MLTNNSGLQIDEHGPGDVLASSGLTEEGVERVITTSDGLVRGHLAIRLDAMLKAVQFPAGITDLDSGLSDVDGDALSLKGETNNMSGALKVIESSFSVLLIVCFLSMCIFCQ